MATYTQSTRSLQIEVAGKTTQDAYGNDPVLLSEVTKGSCEKLSKPFYLNMTILSPTVSSPLEASDMLGRSATVKIKNCSNGWRLFNGIITGFYFNGYYSYYDSSARINKELYQYRAVLEPKLSILSNTRKSRVFHDKSPRTIIKGILDDWQIEYQDSLSDSTKDEEMYYDFEQCVQYEESDLNFISRLMEAEGIFYSFSHGEDDDKGLFHKMVMRDKNPASNMYLTYDPAGGVEAVRSFSMGERIGHSAVRLDKFDYKQADVTFFANDDTNIPQETELGASGNNMLFNDFEAEFTMTKDKADASKYRNKLQEIIVQRLRTQQCSWYGETQNCMVTSGTAFVLNDFPMDDIQGLVTSIDFTAKTTPFSTGNSSVDEDSEFSYSSSFEAQDLQIQFSPDLLSYIPEVSTSLTARVITVETVPGISDDSLSLSEDSDSEDADASSLLQFNSDLGGNPVWVDADTYRVKILMNWRNTNEDGSPDFSSMWMYARFGQLWADAGSGHFEIPRKGQEVMLTFANGNPSAPVIFSSLYNSTVSPPIDVTNAQGIYGTFMRSAAITNDKEEGLQVADTLENAMPLPMTVKDLGKKNKQKNFSQITMFSMDNERYTPYKLENEKFMCNWFFPSGTGEITDLADDIEKWKKNNTGGESAPMHFEGINMYSNKDVLNQAAQSQYINAGNDITICAGNSITLQVGRTKISVKDGGASMSTQYGDPDETCGFIDDYADIEGASGGSCKVKVPCMKSAVGCGPGLGGISAPNCYMSGVYSAGLSTWWGTSVKAGLGASSLSGMKTGMTANVDLGSIIIGLVYRLSSDLNEAFDAHCDDDHTKSFVNGTKDGAQLAIGIYWQIGMIKDILEKISLTLTALHLRNLGRASTLNLFPTEIENSSEKKNDKVQQRSKCAAVGMGFVTFLTSLLPDLCGSSKAIRDAYALSSVNREENDPFQNMLYSASTKSLYLEKKDVGMDHNNSVINRDGLLAMDRNDHISDDLQSISGSTKVIQLERQYVDDDEMGLNHSGSSLKVDKSVLLEQNSSSLSLKDSTEIHS
ncbi:MAG: hypothetical protein GY750_06365 [Lentisphaerae bacterium]|nr:hypothetical protein [Lentisphaerota bacterium]